MVFRLAHISDVHLGPLPPAKLRELASKRVTGYINWKRNRISNMGSDTLKHVVQALKNEAADHIIISGDLINIGLDLEIAAASQWLNANFDPHTTSIVPGNHDAYIRGTLAKALNAWSPFMENDEGHKTLKNADFPYLRIRENVALIGVSSAVATPAFVAAGRFGKRQAKKLANILSKTGEAGLFRVIIIHHPPVKHAARPEKRLYGIKLFQEIIATNGAELILHGHTHLPQRNTLQGIDSHTVPVIGVPSASQGHGGKKPAAAYNIFEISGSKNNWQCSMREHSMSIKALDIFEITDDKILL